jgi:hypothetical protein
MASAPRTIGYTLKSGGTIPGIKSGSSKKSRALLKWAGKRPAKSATQERTEAADRLKRTRPLARLAQRNVDTQHDNDMYRIGGGPVTVIGRDNTRFGKINKKTGKPEYTRGRNLRAPIVAQNRARISFAKSPDGKIISERKAQTLASARPVNRPFGRPSETSPPISKRVDGKTVSNPAYADWKNRSLQYNSSMSRQQLLQPGNTPLQNMAPTAENPTKKYPAPVTKTYVRRGGTGKNKQTPSSGNLKQLNEKNPYIQVT